MLPFNYHGYLPEGVHDCSWEELQQGVVTNPARQRLWEQMGKFFAFVATQRAFSHAYIGGGFVSQKAFPEDIDVILQTTAPYGPEAFQAMAPFFALGLTQIHQKYAVHLHFWCEGFPGGVNDFRLFFQYLRPQDAAPLGLKESFKKGIVRIRL